MILMTGKLLRNELQTQNLVCPLLLLNLQKKYDRKKL